MNDHEKQQLKARLAEYLTRKGIDHSKPFRCLNPQHDDRNPSMSFDAARNIVKCFSCDATYDIFSLIGLDHNLTDFKSQLAKAKELFSLPATTPTPARVTANAESPPVDYTEYFQQCAARLNETDYLMIRGITREVASRFNVGYDPQFRHPKNAHKKHITTSPRLIIPTSPYSFLARDTRHNSQLDETARKFTKQKVGATSLFNVGILATATTPIFICEGEIDALSFAQIRCEAIALGSVAMANKFITRVKQTPPAQPLILALDNDDAGKEASAKLLRELTALNIPTIAPDYLFSTSNIKPYKDANETLIFDDGETLSTNAERAIAEANDFAQSFTPPVKVNDTTDSAGDDNTKRVKLRSMADIDAQPIEWLWHNRIPLGATIILNGYPGGGKTTFIADLAARISNGHDFIDGATCKIGSCILLNAEDDEAKILRPRLDAAYADVNKIFVVDSRSNCDFYLSDTPQLERAINEMHDLRLVVIDPINAFIGGDTDTHRGNEVRAMLRGLDRLAKAKNFVLIIVTHPRKATSYRADDMISGTRDYEGLARAVWHLGVNPDDAALDANTTRRVLAFGKNNYSSEPMTSLTFNLVKSEVNPQAPKIIWETELIHESATQIFCGCSMDGERGRPNDKLIGAELFLQNAPYDNADKFIDHEINGIMHKAIKSNEIFAIADNAGINESTLRRAQKKLEKSGYIIVKKIHTAWYWLFVDNPLYVPKADNEPPETA